MHRRSFLAGLVSVVGAPSAAGAEQRAKTARIGLLDYATFWDPLRQGLRELNYVEGQNIAFEYRPTDGKRERLPDLAAELVRLKVDILVTYGTPATVAAKQATTTIPIVMVGTGDPVRTGLVASLGRPGGNVTGNTILGAELSAKRLELLKEAIPNFSRVAFLWNPTNPAQVTHFGDIQVGARALGVTVQSVKVSGPNEFENAFAEMLKERPDVLYMTADPMHQLHAGRIIAFAAKNRLPAMYQVPENAIAGGLMAYGASLPELFRRAAVYVDKILKGANPADLPVQQPTKFELLINLKTAKALELTIPPSLLLRADQVIQ